MGTAKRAYNILRGYVGQEYDRLSGVERISAEEELGIDVKRTFEATRGYTHTQSATSSGSPDPKSHAAKILGVETEATYNDVKKAYDRLNKRSDPSNFPAGSDESKKAAEIQRRVQWAYQVLSADVDSTEKRFRNLELE
jgi:DnaJ-class molecular chaperone